MEDTNTEDHHQGLKANLGQMDHMEVFMEDIMEADLVLEAMDNLADIIKTVNNPSTIKTTKVGLLTDNRIPFKPT